MKAPDYLAKASVRFRLVCMEFSVLLCKCFDDCSVCIGRLGLYFNVVLVEYFEFKSFCCYLYKEGVERLYVMHTRYKYRWGFWCGLLGYGLSLVRFWFH